LHVSKRKLNLLSVSALKDGGHERLYKLLGQPAIGIRGSLEFGSVSMREQEAHLNRPMRFEMTLMEEEHRDPNKCPAEIAAEISSLEGVESYSSEGAAATAKDVFDPAGGSKSTFLDKRECWLLIAQRYFYISRA